MQALETMKSKGQEGIKQLVTLGKAQSESVKTWGVTAGAAVAGSVALRVGAPGLVAILRTLAPLPVSLTVGAIGGGVLGWLYLERQKTAALDATTAASRAPAPTWPVTAATEPVAQAPAAVGIDQPESAVVTAPQPSPAVEPTLVADTDEPIAPLTSEVADEVAVFGGRAEVADPVPADEPLPIVAEPALESTPVVDVVAVSEPSAQQDDLADIVGIGPVFAAHLQTAGIHTFAQLAALRPEQLEEIMAPSRGAQMIDAADWIEQAGRLAAATTA